ncbi:AraC family ligand binding domain-containing protein, partial [Salmonella enterica subsp. enterica serovar Anatum]|nr:AraC family ligand binding domain-containing protein [Salmonella enterica subsp. enterica serovar Anatum]
AAFPEHHHDFHEIVIVEHGTGIHVFNGQPYTISGGTVCFVRDPDAEAKLRAMKPEEFAQIQQAIITQMRQAPQTLGEEASRLSK